MISIERVLQYSSITSEAPLVLEESRPPNKWPEVGAICFKDLQVIPFGEAFIHYMKRITSAETSASNCYQTKTCSAYVL